VRSCAAYTAVFHTDHSESRAAKGQGSPEMVFHFGIEHLILIDLFQTIMPSQT
jgi:hypothetical protein